MKKIRPLGTISDFVVDELPSYLESRASELAPVIESLINGLDDVKIFSALIGGESDIALLDIKMLEAALVHSDISVPANLSELIDRLCQVEIPGLTYEEIVLANPVEDMRCFTSGGTGETERKFYKYHQEIEIALEGVLSKLIAILRGESPSDPSTVREIETLLSSVVGLVRDTARVQREHFTLFRKYLGVHPVRKTKGPSGAFSSKMAALELYFRGKYVDKERVSYVRGNWCYFPKRDRELLGKAVLYCVKGEGVTPSGNGMPVPCKAPIDMLYVILDEFFTAFRATHYAAVKKQIPEALVGGVAGTGGESDVEGFLKRRMNNEDKKTKQNPYQRMLAILKRAWSVFRRKCD